MNIPNGVAVIALLTIAATVQAQKPGTFGIGVGLGPPSFSASEEGLPPTASIMLPMNFGAFRLEPEFAIANASVKQSDPSGDFEGSISSLTFGTGLYLQRSSGDGFIIYGGPRVGFQRNSESTKFPGQPEDSFRRTDTFFGVALGGEHLFSSHLSLGAEARLTHLVAGKSRIEPPDPFQPDFKASANVTTGIVVVRFYF